MFRRMHVALGITFVALGCGKTADDPPPKPTTIYAHTISSLFEITPSTGEVNELGAFIDSSSGATLGMYDIAISKDGNMFGVAIDGIYRIDHHAKPSPKCTSLGVPTDAFNALTFAPPGTIDASNEVLVAAASTTGKFARIDLSADLRKATVKDLGTYGGTWSSSGDLAAIPNDAIYATVIDRVGGDDHLATIDPKTGAAKDLGVLSIKGVWGLAAGDGALYGFTSDGAVHRIDPKTLKTNEITLKTKIIGGFYGAGP